MIDNELDQLSRALIAATDRLNSQDFKDRQAKYVQMEQEFLTLGSELEAEERAVEKAQAALQQHVAVTYLDAADPLPSPVGFGEGDMFELASGDRYEIRDGKWVSYIDPLDSDLIEETRGILFGADPHFAVLDAESDEFSSPRANGAYTD